MSQSAMETTEEWKVAFAADNIATMTLEQLDASYQAGRITEKTLVWTEGMEQWLPLSEVIGGEEEPEAPAEPQAAFPQAVSPQGVFPPVAAAPVSAPQTFAPPAEPAQVSTAPMALNMPPDDFELDDFAPKKKSKLGLLAAAAVVLGGIGFTVANMSGGGDANAAAAAAPAVAAEGGQPLVAANSPDAPLETAGYEISAKEEASIKKEVADAEEMKAKMNAALEGADTEKEKAKAAKGAMKAKYGAAKARPKSSAKTSGAISKSGSSFDPLNGSLP